MAHEVLGTRERLWGDLIGRRKHAGLDTPGQAVDAVHRWLLSWRRGFLHRTSPDYESYEDYFLGIARGERFPGETRSEEHTSELQSRGHLVCRLLLEKKK